MRRSSSASCVGHGKGKPASPPGPQVTSLHAEFRERVPANFANTPLVELLGGYSRLHSVLEMLRTVTGRLETAVHGRQAKHEPAVKRHKITQRLSPETIAQILAEYQSGISTPVLAKQYDISTTAVKRLLHINGVLVRRYHRLSEDEVLAAVKLYEAGWSLAKIGRKLDADDETVRRRLQQHKVPMRGAHGRR